MKIPVLFITLLFIAHAASANGKVSPNLKTEGDWCSGSYLLIAQAGKKQGTWQWKLDETILSAETSSSINMARYGAGTYTVSLTNASGKVILEDSFTLSALPGPKADFGFDYLFAAGAVKFTNMTTSNTSELTWLWDFGDGTTSDNQYPTHLYKSEGTYLVKLTATDASGCSNTVSMEIVWKYPGH